MILTRTPLRMSFVGGGSDLPAFYRHEMGAVVAAAITQYVYIAVNPKADGAIRASYSRTEHAQVADEIEHPLIRTCLRMARVARGVEVVSVADVPAGTGLGSSSSFTVGLLRALYAFTGRYASATSVARDACHVEIEHCGKPVGKQDQYLAALGGLQHLQFHPNGHVCAAPVLCRPDVLAAFERSLLLLRIGAPRDADSILARQQARLTSADVQAQTRHLAALAGEFAEALSMGDLDLLGDLLHEGWTIKRALADGITNAAIDDAYAKARGLGATGGKLLGAGGGGYLLLYAPPERHPAIIAGLGLEPLPFAFAPTGSEVVWQGA